jgi:hypothetical protein
MRLSSSLTVCAGLVLMSGLHALAASPLLADAGGGLAQGPSLLSASQPGAYALRYWPDRVVLSYSAKEAVTVKVGLAQAGKWAILDDGAALEGKAWRWLAAEKCVALDLPAGSHRVQVGWAGKFQRPSTGLKLPVLMGGKPAGMLECSFDLEKMTATGALTCPTALARVLLQPAGKLAPEQVSV